MLCNPISNYPDSVDPLIFFQDVNLTQTDVMETYNHLISQGNYNEANAYMDNQEGICGYFADFLNALENRIYNLQEYLSTVEPKQPFVSSDSEPVADNEIIWI